MNELFIIQFFEKGKLVGYQRDSQKGRIIVYDKLISAERAVRQLQNKSYAKERVMVISQITGLQTIHRYEPQKHEPEFIVYKPSEK